MRKALTDALIKAASAPAGSRVELADTRSIGLVFRVTDKGARSWSFRYRDPITRKSLRATIGPYPTVTLAKARERAEAMRRQVTAGGDPNAERAQARREATTKTFEALAERYMAEHSRRHKRPKSATEDARNLRLHILPALGVRRFDAIRRGDVIELLEKLVGQGTPIAANRVHALISAIFNFAVDNDLLPANPAARLRKRGVERIASRVLSDDEIRLFWQRIILAPVSRRVGLALRLALLTGARAGEIAGIAREELSDLNDPERAVWILPAARSKNGRAHIIPLGRLASATIEAALELIAPEDSVLFPSQMATAQPTAKEHPPKQKPITAHALAVAMARLAKRMKDSSPAKRIDGAGASSWKAEPPSPHDLRRTVATRLASIDIPAEDVSAVLNHTRRHVTGRHYDQYQRQAEKRRALAAWENALALILNPTDKNTIVPIADARAKAARTARR